MKSFINSRETLVTDAVDGLLASSAGAGLARLDGFPDIKVVLRNDWSKSSVAVVSGGGSGHEPAHAGFVGDGMLTAAVCGEVFASPSVDAILAAIIAVTGEPGCLLIVKNYTGDRLNFGLAAERAKALGLRVEMVVVSDDIALPHLANPRGIAGTLFVHKLAGAKARAGASLDEVYQVARRAAANVRSIGLSLSTCHIPGANERSDEIAADAVEIGLGIHGEPGAETVPFQSADTLVEIAAERLERTLAESDRIAILINSLGGTSPLELGIVAKALTRTKLFQKADYIIGPAPLMTAIDMRGISLSALILDRGSANALAEATSVPAWPKARRVERTIILPMAAAASAEQAAPSADDGARDFILAATASLRAHADRIDALDAKVGDGDTGSTLALASASVASGIDTLPLADGTALLQSIAERLRRGAGGSSGVLLAILFTAAAQNFSRSGSFAIALQAGLEQMKVYGGAKLGDRTMIDALEPALATLVAGKSFMEATAAARAGANQTAALTQANAGRSAYVPASALKGVVDPGAEAVASLFEDLSRFLREKP